MVGGVDAAALRGRVVPGRAGASVGVARDAEIAQHVARHHHLVLAALLQAQVGRAHHVAVERAGEQRERGRDLGMALERLGAHQRRGLVGREEVAIVVEHDQVVHQQAAVGGVGVEHVEVARRRPPDT